MLAEEPDTDAWTLPTARAWSGGTYLQTQPHESTDGEVRRPFVTWLSYAAVLEPRESSTLNLNDCGCSLIVHNSHLI